jgi:hypothetical protein
VLRVTDLPSCITALKESGVRFNEMLTGRAAVKSIGSGQQSIELFEWRSRGSVEAIMSRTPPLTSRFLDAALLVVIATS